MKFTLYSAVCVHFNVLSFKVLLFCHSFTCIFILLKVVSVQIMSVQSYNVPVILSELRREETLLQVSDVLEYVEVVANDIFNRISNRVAVERDKLVEINTRIIAAQAKVDSLRTATSKATVVLSPPKYPAPKKVEPYQSMFSDVDRRMKNVRYSKQEVESRMPDVSIPTLKEKKNFDLFKADLNSEIQESQLRYSLTVSTVEEAEGLGSLPEYLPSVASLLLFNTSKNPYKTYLFTDPLSGHIKKTTRDKIIEERVLEEAPTSIQTGEELGRYQGANDVTYRPKLGSLPEMEVPNILNLPNVAENVLYNTFQPSIAPSLVTEGELPDVDPSLSSNQPPPPPPDDGGLPPISDGPPPPPPPPPPPGPSLPTLGSDSDDYSSDGGESTLPAVDDPRANLMQAIRAAGGTDNAGLKKATERKMKKKKKKEEEETISSGGGGVDLMGDLRNALQRRRIGISGKQGKEEKTEQADLGGGSMMNNISAMIPPPPQAGDVSGSDSDDKADWEDTM